MVVQPCQFPACMQFFGTPHCWRNRATLTLRLAEFGNPFPGAHAAGIVRAESIIGDFHQTDAVAVTVGAISTIKQGTCW